jgi:hypothetical protein
VSTQAELTEEFRELFEDEAVRFEFNPGQERVGRVVGHTLAGGGNEPWVLHLLIKYRGTQSWRRADRVELA